MGDRLKGALALLVVAALTGCGDDAADRAAAPTADVKLALDFTPNAVHAPVYAAVREQLDRKQGVRIRIKAPGSSPDSLKDVLSGATDMGILDIHDLGLAAVKGKDVVAVAGLVQRPLAALITAADVTRPRELEGRKVGVSGLPSDPAFLDAIMGADGGDHRKAEQVTIGFTAVQSLISGRIEGVPAFWNAEGVVLRERGVPVHEFRAEDYGAPPYPEVVLVTRRKTLEQRRDDVEAAVRAIAAGIDAVKRDPRAAVADIAEASGADRELVRAQIDAVLPILGTQLRRPVLEQWADWDVQYGILPKRPDLDRAFAPL
jgi:NitT/TauT family transport system substrate-binding protein/putative hydroxymethylpyrimidine transport system substrate-binding protein